MIRVAPLVGLAAVAACSLAPPPETPPAIREMPEAYLAPDTTGPYAPARWWTAYGDPVLDRVVETALEANLDLVEAVARVEEVRDRYRIARSPVFPTVDAGAEVSRQSQPANTGIGGQFAGDGEAGQDGDPAPPGDGGGFLPRDRFEFTDWSLRLAASYELDFWGRIRNETGAGMDEFLASTADLRTARIQVIATTISTYLEIRELARRHALAVETADLLAERAELTGERYRRGLVSSFELYSIRRAFRAAEAAVPVLASGLAEGKGRLAVLLGRYAGRIDALLEGAEEVEPDPGPVPASLPPELLVQRPDVLAAALRLEAERRRIGARRAALFPSLGLSGTLGLTASEPGEILDTDQRFTSFVGSLLAPIFRGGRLRADVGVAEARYEQRAAAYARTVLTAFQEVETSYRALAQERERMAFLAAQVEEAEAGVEVQRRSYLRGVGDYLAYLDARRDAAAASSELASARRALAEARLAVHRALGGAWVEEPGPAREAVEAILEESTEGRGGEG